MKIKLLPVIKCIILLGLTVTHPSIFADTISKEQFNTLLSYLNRYGSIAKNGTDFYNAGIACHEHNLTSIVHLDKKDLIILFYNDSLSNCVFASIYTGNLTDTSTPSETCVISDSEYKKLFTPWNLDAVKASDRNVSPNPVLKDFLHTLRECMKPVPITNILSDLQSSIQVNGQ
jgi:hypothetical protein